jgi:hypothetical protein
MLFARGEGRFSDGRFALIKEPPIPLANAYALDERVVKIARRSQ